MQTFLNATGLVRFFTGKALLWTIFLAMAAGLATTGQSNALEAKSGQKTIIDVIGQYALDHCGSLMPKEKSIGNAENGQISTAWQTQTIKTGSCKGGRINVLVVYYTSKRGFRGKDKATINYKGMRRSYNQSEIPTLLNKKYRITVK